MKGKLLNLGSKVHVYTEDSKSPLYLHGDAQIPDWKLYAGFWVMYHFARNQSICQSQFIWSTLSHIMLS